MIEAGRNDVFLMEAYMYRCLPQTSRPAGPRRQQLGTVRRSRPLRVRRRVPAGEPDLRSNLAGGGILDVGGYPVSMARLIAGAATGQPFADRPR